MCLQQPAELQYGKFRITHAHCMIVHVTVTLMSTCLTTAKRRRTSAGASRNEAPNYINWPSIFWRPYLVATLLNIWALYLSLSSLTLPLRQRIQPFTTNKTLSGPPLHRDRALFPPCCPGRGVRGGLPRLWVVYNFGRVCPSDCQTTITFESLDVL